MDPNEELELLSTSLNSRNSSVFYQVFFLLAPEDFLVFSTPWCTNIQELLWSMTDVSDQERLSLLEECLRCIDGNESLVDVNTENVPFRVPVHKRFLLEVARSLSDREKRGCAKYFNCVDSPDTEPMVLLLGAFLQHITSVSDAKKKLVDLTLNNSVLQTSARENSPLENSALDNSATVNSAIGDLPIENVAVENSAFETCNMLLEFVGHSYYNLKKKAFNQALMICIKYENKLTDATEGVDPIQWLAKKCIAPDPDDRMLFHQIHFLLAKNWTEPTLLRSTTVQNIFKTVEKNKRLSLLRECLRLLGRTDLLLNDVGLLREDEQPEIHSCIVFQYRIATTLANNHKREFAKYLVYDVDAPKLDSDVWVPYDKQEDTAYPILKTLLFILLGHRLHSISQRSTCNIVSKFVEDNHQNRDHSQFAEVKSICDDFKNRHEPPHAITAFDINQVSWGERVLPLLPCVNMLKLQELKNPKRMMWDHELFLFISYYVCRGNRPKLACIQPTMLYPHIKANNDAMDADLNDWVSDDWKTLYIPYLCQCSMEHQPFHWVLFIVEKETRQVLHLDTLKHHPSNTGETLFDIKRVLHRLDASGHWNTPRTKLGCPIQDDNYSCGKWVCYLVLQHSLGRLEQVYNMNYAERQQAIKDVTEMILDIPSTAVRDIRKDVRNQEIHIIFNRLIV